MDMSKGAVSAVQPALRRSYTSGLSDAGPLIYSDYAELKDSYDTPKCPVVLAHGLLGFDELKLAGKFLPPLRYWRGIEEELLKRGIHAITVAVEPAGTIEARAKALMKGIESELSSKEEAELGVNIIAHSMGCAYLSPICLDWFVILKLKPTGFKVRSLTTISTPHRGSSVADRILEKLSKSTQDAIFNSLAKIDFKTGGLEELTCKHINEVFNPNTLDADDVKYRSYGAVVVPRVWSVFRKPYKVLLRDEGPNDGLVSVESAKWGQYMGTLVDVDHLDLINWANRARTFVQEVRGKKKFNAIAFYLDITGRFTRKASNEIDTDVVFR
ncbi:triacylglycerol lipase [Ascosphaera apis ARSEF 7405]|uniref:Triacylglycerol lipase n=1 Tax=Ascosphaera apis ARSEF 7405 TaxID=392613 RepID=A0A168DU55_9EURO|nr:triacylglycerol lipase [Ascosphaera apis ARSEF 7405]